jgi:hypothetical protein
MSDNPLPEGITEADYHAIEAAVMETVRGRWFLTEYARRTRAGELRLMLDAVERLEKAVTTRASPMLDAAPQARLLMQRASDIAAHLQALAADMRTGAVHEGFCYQIEAQARAVAGLARPAGPEALPDMAQSPALSAPPLPPPGMIAGPPPTPDALETRAARLAALASLDTLSLADKLALFA